MANPDMSNEAVRRLVEETVRETRDNFLNWWSEWFSEVLRTGVATAPVYVWPSRCEICGSSTEQQRAERCKGACK